MMYVLLLLSIVLGVCKSGIYNRFAKAEKPDAGGIFISTRYPTERLPL